MAGLARGAGTKDGGRGMTGVSGKVVVITGASSGIGEAIARELAAGGARLMLGARRVDRLERISAEIRTSDGTAGLRPTDVTRREDVVALVEAARTAWGRVDVLVNNAGVMHLSLLHDVRVEEWERMIDVHLRGALYGIAAVLPMMRAQGAGHVVNIASTGAHEVYPTAGVYCATKHALRAVSEALRQEERGRIRVTLVSPGAVDTELPLGTSDEKIRASIAELYREALSPADVARAVRFAIEQPEGVEVGEVVIRPARRPK